MIYLIFSLLALCSGPLIFFLIQGRPDWEKLIDGFIFVTISGLVLLHIFPDAVETGGWISLLFGGMGLIGPTFGEKVFHQKVHHAHKIALSLGVIGIFLHAGMDGTSLSIAGMAGNPHTHGENAGELLALAVILHRIPVSLTLWWLIQPDFGKIRAVLVLFVMALATLIGFFTGPELLGHASLAWFQAFVAGSLLHVVMHQGHRQKSCCSKSHSHHVKSWYAGAGNFLGVGLLVFLQRDHHIFGESPFGVEFRNTFLKMALETAPALVLAYVLAGLVSVFLSHKAIVWLGKGNSWVQSVKGMAVGLPLPVCSCGIVPLYHSMIKKGAPTAAAMAFFIATPELGIDALLISLPLLGGKMTVIRLVAAAAVAFLVGGFVGKLVPNGHEPVHPETKPAHETFSIRMKEGLRQGLVDIVDHTSPWIMLGLLIASALAPVLQPETLSWIPVYWDVPLFALLGLPLYVCASGATPIVAVLLWNHISPGAAMAFLLTGPATNISTFGVLAHLHGQKPAVLFGTATLAFSVVAGYLVNFFLHDFKPLTPPVTAPEDYSAFVWICFCILIGLVAFSLVKRGARDFLGELIPKIRL